MDTSNTYINMCEKAKEIQILLGTIEPITPEEQLSVFTQPATFSELAMCHSPSSEDSKYEFWFGSDGELVYLNKITGKKVALPRQDQLQEMVIGDGEQRLYNLLDRFTGFLCDNEDYFDDGISFEVLEKYTSPEQLWLAYVMKEKYNKEWNGTEWVKMPQK